MSTGYRRRFRRRLTDGERWGVIVVETAVVNDNAENPDVDNPTLIVLTGYTVCTDPDKHLDTEIVSYPHQRDIPITHTPTTHTPTSDDAYRACAEIDAALYDWDGQPIT